MRAPFVLAVIVATAVVALAWFVLRGPDEERGARAVGPRAASVADEPGGISASSGGQRTVDPAARDADGASARALAETTVPSAASDTQEEDGATAYSVTGRVVDGLGAPVADAVVYGMVAGDWSGPALDSRSYEGWFDDRHETRTGADGRFELGGLEPGFARLAVRAPGFAPLDADRVELPPGDRHDVGDLLLGPGVRLAGRVVDADGRPVASAEIVRVDGSQGFFPIGLDAERGALLDTTAEDGTFVVDTLAAGPWRLMVLSPRHPDALFEGETERAGASVTGLVFALARGVSIAGRVAGEGDPAGLVVRASPATDVRVSSLTGPLPWREAACGADGRFAVEGLEPHPEFRLRVRAAGGWAFDPEWLSESITVPAGPAGARDVVIELEPRCSVSFRLVVAGATDSTGTPEGWSLELAQVRGEEREETFAGEEDDRVARTDDGAFVLSRVRHAGPGFEATLTVNLEGHFPATSAPLRLVPGATADAGTLELRPRPMISVLVREADGGAPVEGVEVGLSYVDDERTPDWVMLEDEDGFLEYEAHHSATTDASGLARLPRIEGRDCELQAYDGRYAPAAPLAFRLAPGERAAAEPTFELLLARGGSVDVRVVDPFGAPAPGVVVEGAGVGSDATREAVTDPSGRALFERLAAGPHRFTAQPVAALGILAFLPDEDPPAPGSVAELEVVDGRRATVTLVRPARGRLVGRVTEGGLPLAGAGLRLEKAGHAAFLIPGLTDQPLARTGVDGRYAIESVNAGEYELVIEHASRAMPARIPASVVEGTSELDVDLPLVVVEGRVVDSRGAPLADARVDVVDPGAPRTGGVEWAIGAGDGVTLEITSAVERSARTAADGSYRLRGLRTGVPLLVRARHDEHREARSGELVLAPGETRVVDLALAPAGKLEVAVTLDGAPAFAAEVEAVPVSEDAGVDPVSSRCDHEGRARLTGLAPGEWTVSAHQDEARASARVTVAVGRTAALALALEFE